VLTEQEGTHINHTSDEAFSLQPRGVGDILTSAFELYRRHFATLIAVAAVVVVPLTIVQYYFWDLVTVTAPTESDLDRLGAEAVSPGFVRASAGALLLAVLGLVIYQVVTGAVARTAAGSILGERLTIGEAYRYGFRRLWSILLIGLLVGLAAMAGFILFVVPGFFVLVRLIASIPALVVEGKRGREALARSWHLVRGYGWPVFGVLVVTFLITGVVTAVLSAPFAEGWFGQAVGAAIGQVLVSPFSALIFLLIYLDLRVRKEELDHETLRRDYETAGVG
jgi:hypothetical protein